MTQRRRVKLALGSGVVALVTIGSLVTVAVANANETSEAGEYGVLFNCATYPSNLTLTRSDVLTRAQSWIAAGVSYDQGGCYSNAYGSYRKDCSGYVSMSWGLSYSRTTSDINGVATVINRGDLQSGDALNKAGSHVALFVRWADAAHTQPVVWEHGGPGAPGEHTWSASYASGYTPIRYNNIRDNEIGTRDTQVAIVGANSAVYHEIRRVDGTWTGFAAPGGSAKRVSIATGPDGASQMLAVGMDDVVLHRVRLGSGAWSGWAALSGIGGGSAKAKDVAIAVMPDRSAQVLIVGWDDVVYHQIRKPDGLWTGFQPVAGIGTTAGAKAKRVSIGGSWLDSSAQILIVGLDDVVYHEARYADGRWSGFSSLGTKAKDVGIAVTDGSSQSVIVGLDDVVYHQARLISGAWSGWAALPGIGTTAGAKAKQVSISGTSDGASQVLITGLADNVVYHQARFSSGFWSGFQPLLGQGSDQGAQASDVAIG